MKRSGLHRAGCRPLFAVALILALVGASAERLEAQVETQEVVPGPNVNVTGGPAYLIVDPFEIVGNPWRNQEVEGHCAVSSRNPAVIVCSGVDYRLVDMPGITEKVHQDSWNMWAQSIDSGLTWMSRLVPGHPLDPVPNVLSAYNFAADPIVVAGAAGIFYHAGLVAELEEPGQGPPNSPGAIYVSTWMHLSDQEDDPEPVKLVQNGISIPALGNSSQFRDRPHLAVGEPNGGTCTLSVPRGGEMVVQTIPATPVYLAFTTFVGLGQDVKTQIHFMKSEDCAQSWTEILKVTNASTTINVGVQIVKFPGSPKILLFWRRGTQLDEEEGESDAIMVTRSDDGGATFAKPWVYSEICAYDQETSATTFRHTTVPKAFADADRAYVSWSDRRNPPVTGQCTSMDGTLNDARVVVSTTTDGVTKTAPMPVDPYAGRGHQLFPSLAVAANRVHVSWLDFRNDASGVFQEYVDEAPIVEDDPMVLPPDGTRNRHTADMFAAEANAATNLDFDASQQISQYIHGYPEDSEELEQLQWNVVNSRNFTKMTSVFFGDYSSTAAETIVPVDPVSQPGQWTVNGALDSPPFTPVFHMNWTDGRHVQLLSDEDYSEARPRPYTPPDLTTAITSLQEPLPNESLFDPNQLRLMCDPESSGTKNIEIYTSRSTHGFYAFAPWNNKSLLTTEGDPVQRAFVVVVQNTNPPPAYPSPPEQTAFRLTIVNQPIGDPSDFIPGRASFEQFSFDTSNGIIVPGAPTTEEELVIRAGSAIARTVYVMSSDPRAAVRVDVEKLDSSGTPVATRAVFLNPDPSAPPNLKRPENVDQTDPYFDIERFEVHGVEIGDAGDPNVVQDIGLFAEAVPYQGVEDIYVEDGWGTPRWQNPRWQNPRWQNPRWQNPRWQNPRWQNPRWQNPRWQNVAVSDEDASAGTRHIRTQVTNTGNTTSAYDARVLVNDEVSEDFSYQLVVYKLYTSTPMEGCYAAQVGYTQVIINIPDYDPSLANFTDPALSETTFSLHPGETAWVELIVYGTLANPPTNFDPVTTAFKATPLAVHAVDGQPLSDPESSYSQLFIIDDALPDGTLGQPYLVTTLQALGGKPPYTWSVADPLNFPPGLTLDTNTGAISGIPTSVGTFNFTLQIEDADLQTNTHAFSITIVSPGISFQLQPGNAVQGQTLSTVVVEALDPFAVPIPGISVTVSLGDDPCSGSTLSGGTTLTTGPTGTASFTTLSLDNGGWGYTLVAAATGNPLINATSDPFNVVGFCNAASLGGPRTEHRATLLSTGKVLFSGGIDAALTPLASAELYDPVTDTFGATGSMGFARRGHEATKLSDGRVLLTGGSGVPGAETSAELFDPSGAGTFSPTGSMAAPRARHTGTLLPNGQVLIAGGIFSAIPTAAAELYDPAGNAGAGSFALTASMGTARFAQTATLLPDGRVLVAGGGGTGGVFLYGAEIFDPAGNAGTGSFAPTGSMGTTRVDHAATLLPDGTVLITGGANSTGDLATAEIFDPAGNAGTGSFTPTGSMSTARSEHESTLLPNGKVLIAGGINLDTAEIYDPNTGTFSPAGSMSDEHGQHTATLLPNGKVLIGGGLGGGSPIASAALFYPTDPPFIVTGFELTSDMLTERGGHTSTALPNGMVLVAGGFTSGSTYLASAELYNPQTGSFSSTGSMGTTRTQASATLLPDGRVLILGGSDVLLSYLATAEIYDPVAGTFSPTGSLSEGRINHRANLLGDGTVLITGGAATPTGITAEIYDPATGTFSPTGPMTAQGITHHTATLLPDGRVLIAGGISFTSGVRAQAELYDPATGSFSATGSMAQARQEHSATLLPNGKVLVTGGSGGSGTLASAEIYDPATGTFSPSGDTPLARRVHTATLLRNGKVVLLGGADGVIPLLTAELYDPTTDMFSLAESMLYSHSIKVTLLSTGKVLITGRGTSLGLPSAELYRPGQ